MGPNSMLQAKSKSFRRCLSASASWSGAAVSIQTRVVNLFNSPGSAPIFLTNYLLSPTVCIAASLALVFFVAPRYGKKYMLVYITICSLIGGLSVSTISGVGSAFILTIQGENQFKHWFLYFLLAFVTVTLLTEIVYLNKALELFNTAMVTPVGTS